MTRTKASKIDEFIIKNTNLFTKGSIMTVEQFRRHTDFITPGLRAMTPSHPSSVMQFVNTQAKLNRVLRKKGLKLKSRNYYTEWYIEEDTELEVNRMRRASKTIERAATDLYIGHRIHTGNTKANISSDYAELDRYLDAKVF